MLTSDMKRFTFFMHWPATKSNRMVSIGHVERSWKVLGGAWVSSTTSYSSPISQLMGALLLKSPMVRPGPRDPGGHFQDLLTGTWHGSVLAEGSRSSFRWLKAWAWLGKHGGMPGIREWGNGMIHSWIEYGLNHSLPSYQAPMISKASGKLWRKQRPMIFWRVCRFRPLIEQSCFLQDLGPIVWNFRGSGSGLWRWNHLRQGVLGSCAHSRRACREVHNWNCYRARFKGWNCRRRMKPGRLQWSY